ncbi:Dol-P-Glc:Glc(2)Man(9)GlcNAc(2)-PP-Dol alpha-1-2-glucosyltransferase [Penicillium angulare]|uniref:Dol-P-Glc:Glc(2)Man(9)GlcNAc(2)-PP-Dol alpha-1-2-glucosyltransferase n=1 Tax=Penicillium angulare TaxID=116970 RepID=UPI002541F253|nr:Dol-P-Glc:Glc(2)Man(9)GlcNAc(2)-PP-Dol alpha-1-2-glucosyltransferase [Penicillium angulare]KAJ5273202.1 Dol-P-Glc:Glc(2)Man(9)GlcNAc(2)-PP-Dol alpha-1-2-glucosyltransferase [Penicillium angulare]
MSSASDSTLSRVARYAVPFGLLLIPIWRAKVQAEVPEAYLDEVFHVPQAQAYWKHQWTHWDPKITTPPGLYLWSYLLCAIVLSRDESPKELGIDALRRTNFFTTAIFLPWRLQTLSDAVHKIKNTRKMGAWLSHSVLNICLFPPLFFFSGLYYTDILALLVVIEAYNWDLKRSDAKGAKGLLSTLMFLVCGLAALACRQTNIFWVSAFLGGLQVVRKIRLSCEPSKSSDLCSIVKGGFKNQIYDPLVSDASLEDYFKSAISFATASLKNPFSTVASIIPHLAILGAFGAFVFWNDGVVLGHKEFHTAGIHLAQMLYIWPYFAFFSWPLLVIPVANLVLPTSVLPKYFNYGFPKSQKQLPKLLTVLAVLPVMLAIVHFNTVVHPFTLADNRHYVFYVFRLLLGVNPAVKYVAVLIYFLCGWAVLSALGFTIDQGPRRIQLPPMAPAAPTAAPAPEHPKENRKTRRVNEKASAKKSSQLESKEKPNKPEPMSPEAFARLQQSLVQRRKEQSVAPRVSFVLVWLAATTLSLVTAPLVEPRYLIIPWVLWRLHLPELPSPSAFQKQRPENEREKKLVDLSKNASKFIETAWFIVINAVTGYLFLYKGFEWPQEPGKVQRFMW